MDPSFLRRRMWDDWQPETRRNFPDRARPSTQRSPTSPFSNRFDRERPRNPRSRVRIPEQFQNSRRPENFKEKKEKSRRRQKMSKDAAAVKIQAAFRGFLVRKAEPLKNLKAIAKLKASMEELRQRINNEKVVELMRRNEKERLKMTEGLMSLLLKLDAIQGANTFVRESRKSVIRELLKLQEIVDAIIEDKPGEIEATTASNLEESANLGISPEEHVDMHIDGEEYNVVSSPDAQPTLIENKNILCNNENEHTKVVPTENPEPDKEDPEKKDPVSRYGNKDSLNFSTESSESLKEFSNNISVVALKQNPEPVKDACDDIPLDEMQENPEPGNEFSHDVLKNPESENYSSTHDIEVKKIVCEDSLNDDSITKQQTTSNPTQMESSDSLSRLDVAEYLPQITSEDHGKFSEKEMGSENNEEIHQLDDLNNLDQIRSWIAEGRDYAAIDHQDSSEHETDRNNYTKTLSKKSEEFSDEISSMESRITGERLKKVIEDLYHRTELQNDIIEHIEKKLDNLQKKILENAAHNKRKRSPPGRN